MTQGELEKIPLVLQKQFSDLEIRIMEDLVRRIKINGFSTASADWQITRLQQLGKSEEDIKEWVRIALDTSDEEIERIFSDEAYEQYMGHERAYQVNGMQQIPFEQNQELQSLIEGIKQQTHDTFQNMTASLGFVKQDVQGHIHGISLTDFYRSTLDQAMLDIHSGAFDYQTVLQRTIEDMTKSGIRWIDYKGGRHNRGDVAARRAVMTGFRQVQGKINEQVAADLGTDSYEVTYHVGARPSHQVWQGRVWTMQQLKDVCGLGSVTGLHGANCYHDYNAFIPGVSVRTYTDEQLAEMQKKENTPKSYNGREYTTYEALQQQRKMERSMRATRQQIRLMEEGGMDKQKIILKKAKYQGQMQTYKDFSKKMKLPEQMDRVYQDGLSGKFMPTKAEIKKIEKPVVKDNDSGIMELSRKSGNSREGFKLISDETFNNLTIAARKKGAVIIRGTVEAEEHLEKLGAAASNIGDVLIFRKDVCISEVLEETYHFEQNLTKMNNDKLEPLRSILNEIDAKQYLLGVADKFKIPRNEIELTRRQLQSYQRQLEEYQKGVK